VQKEMMDPAVKGTTNVLKACSAKKVQKLILVSSIAASCFTLDWPQDKIKDESCWSDKELCRENEVTAQKPTPVNEFKVII
jgi:nucleoside-diphosphate-sugar epimerase